MHALRGGHGRGRARRARARSVQCARELCTPAWRVPALCTPVHTLHKGVHTHAHAMHEGNGGGEGRAGGELRARARAHAKTAILACFAHLYQNILPCGNRRWSPLARWSSASHEQKRGPGFESWWGHHFGAQLPHCTPSVFLLSVTQCRVPEDALGDAGISATDSPILNGIHPSKRQSESNSNSPPHPTAP